MYKFIDTTEIAESTLPAEALQINGQYIENLIAGYRTLNVTGREALSPELDYFETGVRDGSTLKNKRYPARTIIVRYQLIADTDEAFRDAFNQLAHILDVENAQLIFNDEQDKFYTGTPSAIGEVAPGTNSVVGEIEIFCADPFKYSVIEYEAEPDLDESGVMIDYNGTYKAFPILEADFYSETDVAEDGETAGTLTGSGDCGYVAFFNEDAKIVQLGAPEEEDMEQAFAKSQTLMNQLFTGQYAWGDTAKTLWAVNSANGLPTNVAQVGSVASAVATYAEAQTPADTSGTLLKATSTASSPKVKYVVKAKATKRTATTVKVTITITTSLGTATSYMYDRGIKGHVYIGGAWHSATLKSESSYWRGNSGHTKNITVTVSGLTESTTALTGIKFKATRTDSLGTAGVLAETACANLPISAYVSDTPEEWYLKATDYGTGSGWHGAAITRTLGADAAGEVGASNFTLTYKQKMSIGDGKSDTKQLGAFQCQLVNESGANVAGVRIHKNEAGTWASIIYYVNGTKVHGETVELTYNNKYFKSNHSSVPSSKITKSGNKVTFCVAGSKRAFIDDNVAEMKVAKVTFVFEAYGSSPALEYNGLYWAKFVKDNCDTMKDVPNKFSANDIVVADCKDGTIYLNGVHSPELGALGNDWEDFYLVPGLNQIGVAYSDWCEHAPSMKVRYREVFL